MADDVYDEIPLDDPAANDVVLDEDDTPFSEPSDMGRKLPIDHPKTDYDADLTEAYHEEQDEAVEMDLSDDDYDEP